MPESRLPKPQKHKLKKRHLFHQPTRRAIVSGLIIFLVLIMGSGGYFSYVAYHNLHKVLRGGGHSSILGNTNTIDLAALQHEGDARINILVGGYSVDDPHHLDSGSGGAGALLTDSMMIVSIDPVNDTASLVSMPRDLQVDMSKCASIGIPDEEKLNAAYECGAGLQDQDPTAGLAYMSQVVGQVTGMTINYAAVVDYAAFTDLVNAVGNITIDIQGTDPRGILDRNFDWVCDYKCYEVKYPNGPATLDGTQAMYLAQARGDYVAPQYAGYGFGGSDFERQENQRKMLIAIAQKAESVSFVTNPVKVIAFLNGLGSNVVSNIGQNDALSLAKVVKNIPFSKIASVGIPNTVTGSTDPILTTGILNGADVLVPTDGLYDYDQLHSFLDSQLVDPYIIKEHPTIALYNGTTSAGLATQEEAVLKSYGYNVVSVANAPSQNYTNTVFYDTTNGKLPVTKQYLQNRLGVKAITTPLPSSFMVTTTTPASGTTPAKTSTAPPAQYVIILGQNAVANSNELSTNP